MNEGYTYEDMCHFLMYRVDDLIDICDKYFKNMKE